MGVIGLPEICDRVDLDIWTSPLELYRAAQNTSSLVVLTSPHTLWTTSTFGLFMLLMVILSCEAEQLMNCQSWVLPIAKSYLPERIEEQFEYWL